MSDKETDIENRPLLQTNSDRKLPQTIPAPFTSLYRPITKKGVFYLIVGLIFATAYSILPLTLTYYVGNLIDTIEDDYNDDEEIRDETRKVGYVILALSGIVILLAWVAFVCACRLGSLLGVSWRYSFFESLMHKSVTWYDINNPLEVSGNFERHCRNVEKAAGERPMVVYSGIVLFAASWVWAGYVSLQLSLIGLGILPFQIVGMITLGYGIAKAQEMKAKSYGAAMSISGEALENSKTVVSLNAQETFYNNFSDKLSNTTGTDTLMGFLAGFGWSLSIAGLFAFVGIIIYTAAVLINDDEDSWISGESHSAGDSMIVIYAINLGCVFLALAFPSLQAIQIGRYSLGYIISQIGTDEEDSGSRSAEGIKGKIEFRKVTFAFPSRPDRDVLKDISLVIKPGESVAIVGPTGCGKSTVIQLIQKHYTPKYGDILIDDVEYGQYNLVSLRDQMGIVSQEPLLFRGSLLDNIKIGKINATDEEVLDAASKAGAHVFILAIAAEKFKVPKSSLTPEQVMEIYNHLDVGNKGSLLSGGQKQRIAIARTIIKNPKILLLDEATSALDNKTEAYIQSVLDEMMEGKTSIVIAQKLSTIRHQKRIIVIDQGRVVEQGTHDQLIQLRGVYFRIATAQYHTASKEEQQLKAASLHHITSEYKEKKEKEAKETSRKIESISFSSIVKRVLIMSKKYWYLIPIALAFSVLAGVLFPIYGYVLSSDIMNLATEYGDDKEEETDDYILYCFLLASAVILFLTILNGAVARLTALLTYDLRLKAFGAMLYYDQEFFDKTAPGTLTNTLHKDCEAMNTLGGPVLAIQMLMLSALITGIILAFIKDAQYAAVVVLTIPPFGYSFAENTKLLTVGLDVKTAESATDISDDGITNIKTVHSFNREEFFQRKYYRVIRESIQATARASYRGGIVFGSRFSSEYLVWAVGMLYGAKLVYDNHFDVEDMFDVFFILFFSTFGLSMAATLAPDVDKGVQSARNVIMTIDYETSIEKKEDFRDVVDIDGDVELRDVVFVYPSRPDVTILKGISLKINAGESLGVTGTTGCGKSTIVQLLMRFYDPTIGQVLIDGHNIKNYNLKYLRKQIAWVGQEPVLFQASFRDNILMGNKFATREELYDAIDTAMANDFIKDEKDLENMILYKGAGASGGQKQRIAIARALIMKPKILILDEGTSALDNQTEARLMEKLQDKRMTRISIAHRLSTIQGCDQIALFELGVLIEIGTHKELMDAKGCYYKLVTA
jgi:ATP-binding cassette subfamily B (MDR/TAP) protein 1